MRAGVRLGVDVGKVRIGLAASDLHGMMAIPVATVPRGAGDVARILAEAIERSAVEIVVGLPLALSGNDTASTRDARIFAAEIASHSTIAVRMVDERMSTVSATRALQSSGRSAKKSRVIIDQVAAVIILQHALDVERSSGTPPGVSVDPDERR